MKIIPNEIEKIEILTLQDNYIDLVMRDNSDIVERAMPVKEGEIKNSLLAEHGFSSLVTVSRGNQSRKILFDFGFSAMGAAFNADALGVDLSDVEVTALSHGHLDHVGGLSELIRRAGRKEIELIVHPDVFRGPRYSIVGEGRKVKFPEFTRQKASEAGVSVIETQGPRPLLDGDIVFLGGIPRRTDFEKGAPNLIYMKDGKEIVDDIPDDTSIVANVRGRGLVILSGCAHSGIINTVNYAREITGVTKVFVIMGGFHLTGPHMAPVIGPTVRCIEEIQPTYVVPTHCTGRNAVMQIERQMPESFILNMVGTRLTFSA
ncbi:Beta-lactamase domain protein [uncultured Desulfobacterium sp.]|uniref:Beta-lactamase domain protein n=1 Tax=uncultured Desulfobacterium sp. TaxID=201089 RepID=A0A445N0A4_9BACT|nr:Beta-lactamase domain protein [uncultured Desulfobacterium sp.]